MKNIIYKNYKIIIGIIIGVITTSITVYASTLLASDISFVPNDTNWKVQNVQEALDNLYSSNLEKDFNIQSVQNYGFGTSKVDSISKELSTGKYLCIYTFANGGYTTVKGRNQETTKNVTVDGCNNFEELSFYGKDISSNVASSGFYLGIQQSHYIFNCQVDNNQTITINHNFNTYNNVPFQTTLDCIK